MSRILATQLEGVLRHAQHLDAANCRGSTHPRNRNRKDGNDEVLPTARTTYLLRTILRTHDTFNDWNT